MSDLGEWTVGLEDYAEGTWLNIEVEGELRVVRLDEELAREIVAVLKDWLKEERARA